MANKLTWNATKKELWGLKPQALMKKLQQLETERMKIELYTRGDGHSNARQNMAGGGKAKNYKIKDLRHKIACIKTMLHVKLQAQ